MPTLDETITRLRGMFLKDARVKEDLRGNPGDDLALEIEKTINQHIRAELLALLRYPPHLLMNPEIIPKFFQNGSYNDSVFIMTKFPESAAPADPLNRIIAAVKASVKDCGLVPRIASDPPEYSDQLWDNVVVHLMCCLRGIAIVENKYRDELNPNVTLEWGWMRAAGKQVLYLREKTFSKERADLMGFIHKEFDWDDPEDTIPPLVKEWLSGGKK